METIPACYVLLKKIADLYRHENKYGMYFLSVAFFCGTAYYDQLVSVCDLFSGISVISDT